jgi:hypothetical protein
MGAGGRRDPCEYTRIMAEVFFDTRHRKVRVRPVDGEVFPSSMNIECSRKIRELPLGSRVRLDVVETEREDGQPFLYSSYKWKYELV